ncbi:hypothetical protein [Xanthomonas theicola]|uniref:Transmembrane protein n=1 Tax=Xanthomonas theicola TaxID=56464 RepID=A0A2S6ZDI3_9XANT|nr:hypothetical protein [Xanthomonas theicola]PPT90333.1 hypothetical protein XthCFBP4691_12830 [Xanthomonas theicola]QNH26244.1 hypothetical protein G4Q83_17955 [Xanthomonas theicola]
MSKLTIITDRAVDRALDLASHAGDSLRHIGPQANKWLQSSAAMGALKTGAAMGAVKTGSKVARSVVRRNPVIAIAAVALGAGLLGYAVYRKRQRNKNAPIEGDSRRIEASKRGNAGARRSATRVSRRAAAAQEATEE